MKRDGGANLSDLLRQIDYFLEQGAENCLALGGDLDGCTPIPEIKKVSDYQILWDRLIRAGYPLSLVCNLFFGNADRFAKTYFL